jgi:hypothetical protein
MNAQGGTAFDKRMAAVGCAKSGRYPFQLLLAETAGAAWAMLVNFRSFLPRIYLAAWRWGNARK